MKHGAICRDGVHLYDPVVEQGGLPNGRPLFVSCTFIHGKAGKMTQKADSSAERTSQIIQGSMIHAIILGVRFLRRQIVKKPLFGIEKTFASIKSFSHSEDDKHSLVAIMEFFKFSKKDARFFDLENFGYGVGVPSENLGDSFLAIFLINGRCAVIKWHKDRSQLIEYGDAIPGCGHKVENVGKSWIFGKRCEWLREFLDQLAELPPG